ESFPWSKRLGWTIKEFGPLPVPAEGQVVSLDSTSILFYQHIIRYEQKKKLSLRDKLVYLGDSLIREYRFRENYYFVSGDNMENSRDSRYWGLLPESYIVGKATRIWKSEAPGDGHIRWDRVWKGIK
ncbi:MAG: signal peptidase I, partial [Bacteroides sp.]|nr:signal peptidase I [Bacteroides sp.]